MHPFVKSLKESPFFTVLTHPVQAAIRDLHNIFSTRTDLVGSFIRLLGNIGCFIVGILLVYQWSPSLSLKLEAFWLALNAPEYMVTVLIAYSGGWLISYPGGEVVRQSLRVFNYCKFGDYDYFLTPSEIDNVAKKIIKAEARDISDIDSVKEEVLKVLEYCTEKIRSTDESIQDMANVYKKIFISLRKGDLVPYYEHSTLMKTQEQKMVEIAQKGRAEILKIEKQIQALQDGISIGDESDSGSDLEDEEPQPNPRTSVMFSPKDHMPDLSGFKVMQAQIVREIRDLERKVSYLGKSKHNEETKGTLPEKLNSCSLSLQRVALLNKQKDSWEQYLVLLTKKRFSLLQSKFEIEIIIQRNQKKVENILSKKDSHIDDEQITRFIQSQESSITFEQERQKADLLSIEHELEAVGAEINSASSKLESSGVEKSTLEEEVKALVLRTIDITKDNISSLESKVSENELEIALIESDTIFIDEKIRANRTKIRDAYREKSELQRRTSSYDLEANSIDESLSVDHERDREVIDVEHKSGDSPSDSDLISQIKVIEKKIKMLEEKERELEEEYRSTYDRINTFRSARASLDVNIRNARQEVSELTIGSILSLPIEKRFKLDGISGSSSRNGYYRPINQRISPSMYREEARMESAPVYREIRRPEPVKVLPPSEEASYDSPLMDDGSSGGDMTVPRSYEPVREAKGVVTRSMELPSIDRGAYYSDESTGGRRVRIDAVSPTSRRRGGRTRAIGDGNLDSYHMHIRSKLLRSKARHVSSLEATEKENIILQLRQRKKHLQKATKSAEKRYKAV